MSRLRTLTACIFVAVTVLQVYHCEEVYTCGFDDGDICEGMVRGRHGVDWFVRCRDDTPQQMVPEAGYKSPCYMFAKQTGSHHKDRMKLPRVKKSGQYLLTFRYNMYASTPLQKLIVGVFYHSGSKHRRVWNVTGPQTDVSEWKHAQVKMTLLPKDQITIDGITYPASPGTDPYNIAVDSVHLQYLGDMEDERNGKEENEDTNEKVDESKYPDIFSCDFGDPESRLGKLCRGMKQDISGDMNWYASCTPKRQKDLPGIEYVAVYPSRGYQSQCYLYSDPTEGFVKSHTLKQRHKEAPLYKKARILLPVVKEDGRYIVDFRYHMAGKNMGTLKLLCRDNDGTQSVVWSVTGEQSQRGVWQRHDTTVDMQAGDQLLLESVTTKECCDGVIAVDDVHLKYINDDDDDIDEDINLDDDDEDDEDFDDDTDNDTPRTETRNKMMNLMKNGRIRPQLYGLGRNRGYMVRGNTPSHWIGQRRKSSGYNVRGRTQSDTPAQSYQTNGGHDYRQYSRWRGKRTEDNSDTENDMSNGDSDIEDNNEDIRDKDDDNDNSEDIGETEDSNIIEDDKSMVDDTEIDKSMLDDTEIDKSMVDDTEIESTDNNTRKKLIDVMNNGGVRPQLNGLGRNRGNMGSAESPPRWIGQKRKSGGYMVRGRTQSSARPYQTNNRRQYGRWQGKRSEDDTENRQ